jgi:T4 bacteriophage base plate protein
MALPKLDVPTYEIVLPVSKKKIKYRPFLVKEQRNLLMAMEASEANTIQQAVKDILYNCTLTEGIDIDKLPIIDVEFYFINLRAKSVGEVVESKYKCNNEVDGKVCGNIMEKDINLMNVKVTQDKEVSDEIQLDPKIAIKLKYPEFSIVENSLQYDDINEVTFNMVAQSIEYIYDGEQFYYAAESQPGEMLEFVEGMNQEQFAKVEEFFNNLPKLKETIEMDCSKCGFHHKIDVEGLESFFV